MKKIAIIAAALLASATASFAQTWTVDNAHSRLGFSVPHLSISEVNGNFNKYTAVITSSKDDFSDASLTVSADIASVNTDIEARDKHLKSPDFFDAEKYPTLSFKSTSFTKTGAKEYTIVGDLTLHGVTKPVTLKGVFNGTAKNPQSQKTIAGFKFTGVIKRSDFGVAAGLPTAMLGDEVQLLGFAEFIKD